MMTIDVMIGVTQDDGVIAMVTVIVAMMLMVMMTKTITIVTMSKVAMLLAMG